MNGREIQALKKENADLKKRIEEWMDVYVKQGDIIEELKQKLIKYETIQKRNSSRVS